MRIGDTVSLQRAGDVIPQVLGVLLDRRPERRGAVRVSRSLPGLRQPGGARRADEVVRRCTGGLICAAQRVERLIHFVSRPAFDIDGLGEKTIREFYEEGWLHSPADLFRLPAREAEIAKREGWGTLSARNLVRAIDARGRRSRWRASSTRSASAASASATRSCWRATTAASPNSAAR